MEDSIVDNLQLKSFDEVALSKLLDAENKSFKSRVDDGAFS